jgi:hypothetical protein
MEGVIFLSATAMRRSAAVVTQDADFSAFVSVPVIRVVSQLATVVVLSSG